MKFSTNRIDILSSNPCQSVAETCYKVNVAFDVALFMPYRSSRKIAQLNEAHMMWICFAKYNEF